MKALVTGGSGFIGSHLVDALIGEGHDVVAVDDLSSGSEADLNAQARLYRVNITDFQALDHVFHVEKPAIVFHLAAQTSVRHSMADPSHDARVNIIGSINTLRSSVTHGSLRMLFSSTCAVYSEPEYVPMDESHPIRPQSAYGMAKHTVENYIRLYSDIYGLKYKVFRYGNVYGPRQSPEGEAGVIAIFTGQMLSGARPTIFGNGTKTRDYVFVKDVVAANIAAMNENGDDEIFNIASGIEVSDLEIFRGVREATGLDVEPNYSEKRPGEADRIRMDCSKAKTMLAWQPTVSLHEGIHAVVAHNLSYYHHDK